MKANKMTFEKWYSDNSGVEFAVRLDGEDIEFESIHTIRYPISELSFLISALERIKSELQ